MRCRPCPGTRRVHLLRSDIAKIVAIAETLKLDENNVQRSYLTSDFTWKDYRGFWQHAGSYDDCVHLLTAKDDEGVC
jgi:hypothetical protein